MLGVLLLHALPEVLREFSVYRMLIYGFVLVLLAIFRPQGLFPQGEPLIRRGRRLPRARNGTDAKPRKRRQSLASPSRPRHAGPQPPPQPRPSLNPRP